MLLMIRRTTGAPRGRSSAASEVYGRRGLVFFVLVYLSAVCAFAEPEGNSEQEGHWLPPVQDPGSASAPEAFSVICYSESAAFVIEPPEGWDNDSESASLLGLCAMYVPNGSSYFDASAKIYPNVGPARGKTVEESADLQAEWIRSIMRKRSQGENVTIRKGTGLKSEKGQDIAIRYYEQGPPPNEWEAAAYLQYNGRLFMLVLNARDKTNRDERMHLLEEAARKVVSLDFSRSEAR